MQPAGQSFSGAHVVNLSSIVTDDYLFGAHNGVTAYYDGTIDTKLTNAGGLPILDSWYGTTSDKPARDKTGYLFSRMGAGSRPSDGLAVAFGGKASRTSAGQSGTQWANAFAPTIATGNVITSGQTVTLSALYNDRDGAATIRFFLDLDRNPLNGTGAKMGSKVLSSASAPTSMSVSAGTTGFKAGKYYLGACITDADGHVRYVYNTSVMTVGLANFASVDSQGAVTVSGTSVGDRITFAESLVNGVDVLQIVRNGVVQNVPYAGITSIVVDSGDGSDLLDASKISLPVNAFGGNGNDQFIGGSGNDTLVGGAGNNILIGNDGDDSLTGSAGNDSLVGGNGNDILSGLAGNDTLDGGGGKDRLLGGDGDDSLLGGDDLDKLYGGAGADTFNGGRGGDYLGDVDNLDTVVPDAVDTVITLPPVP
jgi:Ca2+-binding RTX toxin-like protein